MDVNNQEDLIALSEDFDKFVYDKCMEYGISPLEVGDTIIARLYRICSDVEQGEDYKQLLDFAANENLDKFKDKSHLTLVPKH